MSKLAIVTRADENIKEMSDITHVPMREYAERCGADFKILSHDPPFMTEDNKPHYRCLKIIDLFDEYDRILMLDSDMLINKDCPNLFDLVPEDCIGSIYEDIGSRRGNRLSRMQQIQSVFGDVGWRDHYTNAGTFMLSKMHKNIFAPVDGNYWTSTEGNVDVHMSYNIHKYGYKVFELDYRWNHMTMFSEAWNNNADRFQSYIIHYGGNGIFDMGDPNITGRIKQIKKDYMRIYGGENEK
jgi:hypothetical protein